MARHKRSAVIAALTLVVLASVGIGAALASAKQPSPAGGSGTSSVLKAIAPKTVAKTLWALPGSVAEESRDMATVTAAGGLAESHEAQPLGATTATTGTTSTGRAREESTETPPKNSVAALAERNEP